MLTDLVAGTAGGVAVVLVGHPFDTTKTRLQTAPVNFYNGTIDCVQKTIRWEGPSGFYAGIFSPLAGQMLFRAVSFTTFFGAINAVKNWKLSRGMENSQLTPKDLIACGMATGFAVSFIESPIDFIKTKLQVQIFAQRIAIISGTPPPPARFNSVYTCSLYYIRNHGFLTLYTGFRGTLVRNIPANGAFFAVNEMVKNYLSAREGVDPRHASTTTTLIAGACAGLSYWVGTYPLDVVKSHMQCVEIGSPASRMGWWASARSLYLQKGLSAFTAGFVPCALRSIPACSTMFATVHYVRTHVDRILHA